jgi:hypothetical protein
MTPAARTTMRTACIGDRVILLFMLLRILEGAGAHVVSDRSPIGPGLSVRRCAPRR